MRALAAAWPEQAIVQQPIGRLPWGQVTVLLKLHDPADRDWYAQRATGEGWSRKVLEHHIATGLRARIGAAPNNFPAHLDPEDADLAREIVKDPYVFDFLEGLVRRSRSFESSFGRSYDGSAVMLRDLLCR